MADRIPDAQQWAVRTGWKALMLPAKATSSTGTSAGVAVLCRSFLGLFEPPGGCEVVPYRVIGAMVNFAGHDPICVVCCYLKDCEGLSDFNMFILYKIGGFVSSRLCGYLIGGDFNMEPQVLSTCQFVEALEAQLVSTSEGTCRTTAKVGLKTYDFFIVSSGLSKGVAGVGVDRFAPTSPHSPVCLKFH